MLNEIDNGIYQRAKNGGDYAKFYEQYKNKYTKSLDKAIRSYAKVIAEHELWISDPTIKLTNNPTPEYVAICIRKWQSDIKRNEAYKAIIEGLKKERNP